MSIKRNYIYNSILSILNIIFPLVTFPYVSRILGPENLGKVNFAQSFIMTFVVFVIIVNPLYAIREISQVKNDKKKLDKIFSELLLVGIIAGIIISLVYLCSFLFIEKLRNDPTLYLIFGLNILFSGFFIEWLFQGLEKFKYITIRNIIIKLVSVGILFLFVREKADYLWYAAVMIFAVVGSVIVNLVTGRKYVSFRLKELNIKRHLLQISVFYLISIVTAQAANLDKLLLGFKLNDDAVGVFVAADKIIFILITLISSLSLVLIPRISSYFAEGKMDLVYDKLNKSFKFILMFSLPAIAGIYFIAPEMIRIISGDQYLSAIPILRILSIKLLLMGICSILGLQFLISVKREMEYFISIVSGLLISVPVMLILINLYKIPGAAIGTLVGIFVQALMLIIFTFKDIKKFAFKKENIKYVVATGIMAIVLYILHTIDFKHYIIRMAVLALSGMSVYGLSLLIMKEQLIGDIIQNVKGRLLKK